MDSRWYRGSALALSLVALSGLSGCGQGAVRATGAAIQPDVRVLYTVPGAGVEDGTLHVLTGATDSVLGRCTHSALVAQTLGNSALTCTNFGAAWLFAVDPVSLNVHAESLWADARVALPTGQGYVAQGPGRISATLWSGAASASYDLPRPVHDARLGVAPARHKGGPIGTASTVTGLAQGSNGHVYATVADGVGLTFKDLTTGRSVDMPMYGAAEGLAVGSDGAMRFVAWQPYGQSRTMRLVTVDGASMNVLGEADTKLLPATTDGVQLIRTREHGDYVLVAQGDAGKPIVTRVWRVGAAGLEVLGPLPTDVGLFGSVGPGDNLYIYGGPARNRITSVDPANGAVTDVTPILPAVPPSGVVTDVVFTG